MSVRDTINDCRKAAGAVVLTGFIYGVVLPTAIVLMVVTGWRPK